MDGWDDSHTPSFPLIKKSIEKLSFVDKDVFVFIFIFIFITTCKSVLYFFEG